MRQHATPPPLPPAAHLLPAQSGRHLADHRLQPAAPLLSFTTEIGSSSVEVSSIDDYHHRRVSAPTSTGIGVANGSGGFVSSVDVSFSDEVACLLRLTGSGSTANLGRTDTTATSGVPAVVEPTSITGRWSAAAHDGLLLPRATSTATAADDLSAATTVFQLQVPNGSFPPVTAMTAAVGTASPISGSVDHNANSFVQRSPRAVLGAKSSRAVLRSSASTPRLGGGGGGLDRTATAASLIKAAVCSAQRAVVETSTARRQSMQQMQQDSNTIMNESTKSRRPQPLALPHTSSVAAMTPSAVKSNGEWTAVPGSSSSRAARPPPGAQRIDGGKDKQHAGESSRASVFRTVPAAQYFAAASPNAAAAAAAATSGGAVVTAPSISGSYRHAPPHTGTGGNACGVETLSSVVYTAHNEGSYSGGPSSSSLLQPQRCCSQCGGTVTLNLHTTLLEDSEFRQEFTQCSTATQFEWFTMGKLQGLGRALKQMQ